MCCRIWTVSWDNVKVLHVIVMHKHPFLYFRSPGCKSRRLNRNLELQEIQRQVRRSIESCSATFSSPRSQLFKIFHRASCSASSFISAAPPWETLAFVFSSAHFCFHFFPVMRAGFVKRYNNAAGWINSLKNCLVIISSQPSWEISDHESILYTW